MRLRPSRPARVLGRAWTALKINFWSQVQHGRTGVMTFIA
jgi:hypothetical protein